MYERGLVTRRISAQSVLKEHQAFYYNTSQRVFAQTVVGFISPWTPSAAESLWRFGRKLTHAAPVLYDAVDTGHLRCKLGEHGGERWLKWLRAASKADRGTAVRTAAPPRLVPLVSFEQLDLLDFFTGEGQEARAGTLLVSLQETLLKHRLHGFVLDAHQYLARLASQERRLVQPAMHVFVQLLAAQLSEEGGELLLYVPPHPGLFSPTEFSQLYPALGGVILQTANYSAIKGEPGPMAPLTWMRSALAALKPPPEAEGKLIAAVPMVGWDFTLPDGPNRELGAAAYLSLLRRYEAVGKFDWHEAGKEHAFKYSVDGVDHVAYFPSLRGLAERVGVLRSLHVGAAFWEIGNSLDYFWDLM